jgi:hypothetical protein
LHRERVEQRGQQNRIQSSSASVGSRFHSNPMNYMKMPVQQQQSLELFVDGEVVGDQPLVEPQKIQPNNETIVGAKQVQPNDETQQHVSNRTTMIVITPRLIVTVLLF